MFHDKIPYYLLFLVSLAFLSSCSIQKVLPEGKRLYTGYTIEVKGDSAKVPTRNLVTKLEDIKLKPQENKKFFWAYARLRFYSWFSNGKEKGLVANLRKKLGEPPVVFEVETVKKNMSLLGNLAKNNGHFNAEIDTIFKFKKHRAQVKYIALVKRPYRIDSIENTVQDATIAKIISRKDRKTAVTSGDIYQLDELEVERQRLEKIMKQKGYFYFKDDLLIYQADSTKGDRQVNLRLKLKEGTPERALVPQFINNIYVYPDYDFKKGISERTDTLSDNGLIFIAQKSLFNNTFLNDAIPIEKGDRYSPKAQAKLISRLSGINAFKFVNVDFTVIPGNDSLLNLHIYITPFVRQGLKGEVGLALRSNIYLGPLFSITYTNRNLFRHADELRINVKSSFNFPLQKDATVYRENGGTVSLSRPGIFIPFVRNKWSVNLENALTTISLSMNRKFTNVFVDNTALDSLRTLVLTERETIGLNELDSLVTNGLQSQYGYGVFKLESALTYSWKRNKILSHSFTPGRINIIFPTYEKNIIKKYVLFNTGSANKELVNLEKMLLLDATYSISLQSLESKTKRHRFYNRTSTGFGANWLLRADTSIPDINKFESKFLKLENDFRYYYRLAPGQVIAFRFGIMQVFPLQKNVTLPALELYHVGGANDVRAFAANSLGPGTVPPSLSFNTLSGLGDFKLISSLEFRNKVYDFIEFGYFIDAGNVWTNFGEHPFKNGLKELAIGVGAGLRLDFDIILVRLDFAVPLTQPWRPEGERTVGRHWYPEDTNKWAKKWLGQELTFHFVIGYPF